MTDLITAEDAKKLLDGSTPGPWEWTTGRFSNNPYLSPNILLLAFDGGGPDGVDPNDAANARLIAAAPDLARTVIALHAQLADAQAAQAMVVERCAEFVERQGTWMQEHNLVGNGYDLVQQGKCLRALAPADGLAAVDALRAEIADLKMNMDADLRTMVREGQQLRTLAAELAQARADTVDIVRNVWGRCEALEDEAADKLAQLEKLTDHEKGFWRGQKTVAKSIRRSTEMPTAEAIAIRRAEGGKA
jgi:hypothetical protein